jgi:hypothetical protein
MQLPAGLRRSLALETGSVIGATLSCDGILLRRRQPANAPAPAPEPVGAGR